MSFKENRQNHSLQRGGFLFLYRKEVSLLPRVICCAVLVLLVCLCALPVFAEPVQSTTDPVQNTQITEPSSAYTNVVRPVSVDEFNTKINHLLDLALGISGSLLVKIAMLMMIVSAFVTVVGWFFRFEGPKDLGIRGLIMSSFGLLVFWSVPFIVRLINAVAKVLNS